MRKRTFYAAKVNIHGNIFSQDLDELINVHIPRVILESTPVKINTWNWSFTDVKKINIDGHNLIIGNVTKSKKLKQTVRNGSATIKKLTNDEIAHPAFFVYDPSSEILAHESTGAISAEDFRDMFTQLLSSDIKVGEVKLFPIPIPQKIRQEILQIENVTNLNFYLIHPNPGKDEFNLYQLIIRENGLKQLNIEMENKDGIEVNSNSDKDKFKRTIEYGVKLVESGYGTIEVKGFNKTIRQGKKKPTTVKRKKSFSSNKSVQRVKLLEYNEDSLIKRLFSFIDHVKTKTKNEGEDIGK